MLAIKLLTRRLLGAARFALTAEEIKQLAGPVLKLLSQCLADYGQLPPAEEGTTPYAV